MKLRINLFLAVLLTVLTARSDDMAVPQITPSQSHVGYSARYTQVSYTHDMVTGTGLLSGARRSDRTREAEMASQHTER